MTRRASGEAILERFASFPGRLAAAAHAAGRGRPGRVVDPPKWSRT